MISHSDVVRGWHAELELLTAPVSVLSGNEFLAFEKTKVRNALWRTLGIVFWFGVANYLHAQQVLAPPPPAFAPQTNLIATLSRTNQTEGVTSEAIPSGGTTSHRLWDLGPVHLHPRMFYSISYGNGIQSQPGNHSKTVVNTISPGMAADIGTHWHLDYTPTLRFYSSHEFKDEVDHSVTLNWGTTSADWALGASQSYASSSTPLIETASQTDTETYSTVLSAAYQLNSKVSLNFLANQTFQYVNSVSTNQPLSDSKTWSTTEGFNYQIFPRLSAGATLGFTYGELKVGSDMTSEQLQGQLNWHLGNKLSFSFHGGFEDRQFLDSNVPDALNPIFGLSLVYNLFEFTTIAFSADRTVTTSYFQNEITEAFGFTGSIHQRLLQRLYLDMSGGFTTSSFQATTTGLSVNREDDLSTVTVRLSCPFLQHGNASVFYNWSDNSSNQGGFGYTSNQVGLELGYRF